MMEISLLIIYYTFDKYNQIFFSPLSRCSLRTKGAICANALKSLPKHDWWYLVMPPERLIGIPDAGKQDIFAAMVCLSSAESLFIKSAKRYYL